MKLSSLEDKLDFRVAALTIEIIYRRKLGFDKSFLEACKKAGVRGRPSAYDIAYRSLLSSYLAEKVLVDNKLGTLPLRRKSAFIVAFRLIVVEKIRCSPFIFGGLIPGRLQKILHSLRKAYVEEIAESDNPIEKLSLIYSHPKWLVEKLVKNLGLRETERILKSNETEVMWLRVNTLKTSLENARRRLEKEGVRVAEDREYPILLRVIESKKSIDDLRTVKRGYVIPQDKASVAAVYALNPRPGETVLDACAAPGVKTSLIAQLMENRGRIVALDISDSRLDSMKSLLKRLGAQDIEIIRADSTKIAFRRKLDKALVDAPCTNSGAIRKDPALRITLRKVNLNNFTSLQKYLLSNALRYSNEVVYATCSLAPEEGEEVVENMQNSLVELKYIGGTTGYRKYSSSKLVRRFFPHMHQTIGFFIAKLRANTR